LIKNKHVDRLISILEQEKEKASKAYFERLIQTPKLGNGQPNSPSNNPSHGNSIRLSPIEELFHRHMKKSLIAYEEYYQKLKQKYEATLETVKNEYTKKMIDTKEKYESKSKKNPNHAGIIDSLIH
jgi:hypothetical protein